MPVLSNVFSFIRKNYFNSNIAKLLFYVLTVLALIVALQHYYIIVAHNSSRFTLSWHITFNLFYWWCWLLFLPFIRMMNNKINVQQLRALYLFVTYLLMPVVIVLIHQIIAALVIHMVLGIYNIPLLIYKRVLSNSWVWVDSVIYFLILLAVNIEEYRKRSKLNKLKLNRLQARLAESQLNALKSQLHPHFLFNTLNTISTLILKENNVEAERMLGLLNNFLKSTVYVNRENEISLEEELKFINRYLEIEKVRFKNKLVVNEEIDENTLRAKVPSFLLQPIIENAIHYAIAPKKADGIISITAKKENEFLCIYIDDNGPGLKGFEENKSAEGVGLKITKERLTHHFGKNHLFELNQSAMGGLNVSIKIPFKKVLPAVEAQPAF